MRKHICMGRVWAFSALLCCLLSGCAEKKGAAGSGAPAGTESRREESGADAQADDGGDEAVTIWLDAESDYLNRRIVAGYQYAREHYGTGDLGRYYPEISWDVVDKSYLTPEQYRAELMEALDAGEGPDVIFMDAYNGVSPEDMMDGGYLAELTQYASWYGEDMAYASGTLEAGRRDGKQYVVPVSMQLPVLFGVAEDLEREGIDAENGYGTLKEFLKALLSAHERTGKLILENAQAVDWLERYYADAQDGETRKLLDRVRACCGTDEGAFAAYEALDGGKALLGGCGVTNSRRMGMNLALFSEGQTPAFLYVPTGNGAKRAVITQAVGVNKKSGRAGDLNAALHMYWSLAAAALAPLSPVAEDDYEGSGIEPYLQDRLYGSFERKYWQRAAGVLTDAVKADFIETAYGGAQEAVYAARPASAGTAGSVEKAGEKKVITVLYADYGLGDDYPVTGWLERAAAGFNIENEGYHVQLLKAEENPLFYGPVYSEFCEVDMEPDVALLPHAAFGNGNAVAAGGTADVAGFLDGHGEETDFLPECLKGGAVRGDGVSALPYAADAYGVWCSKETLKKAGLPEDWRPESLEELNDGLRLMKEAGDVGTGAAWECSQESLEAMLAFSGGESAGGCYAQETDGTARLSRAAWENFIKTLAQMRDEGTVTPTGLRGSGLTQERAAYGLAEGTVGAVIDNGSFGGWYDGAHGLDLTEGQREGLMFVPLSPLAEAHVFCISENSGCPEAAMEFWLYAMQSETYETSVRAVGMHPLGGLAGQAQGILPYARAENVDDLWNGLWLLGKTAEELGTEEYSIFEWMEDSF